MPLHDKKSVQENLLDDIYASTALSGSLPKYRIPDTESDPRVAYTAVHDELMLDGNSRQNLATFCQTWSEPEVHRLMDECMDKNMVDKDEYPQTAEIESRCVHMLADLWNSPQSANTIGCSTTGSSEAAMLAGMAMKWRWRAKRKALGKSIETPNMICGPVQICWHKFARYWDIELREIPMAKDRLIMSPEEVLQRCDENTIGVVPTLGEEGYCKIHTACYETAEFLAHEIGRLGPFEIIYNGKMDAGIPALCWKMKNQQAETFTLYDFANVLRASGWQVPAYSMPANYEELVIQRILVRHGVSRDLAVLLLDDMKRALDFFEKHPVHASMTPNEMSGFKH